MSTRGVCGFRKNGQDKLAYNHCDSYPEGLGNDIVGLCRQTSIEQFNKVFDAIVLIPYGTEATSEQVKEVGSTWSTFDLSSGKSTDWCYLLDKAEGKLESYTEGGLTFMVDSADFIKSSLFCEWAYIINLDTNKLEIWNGWRKHPSKNNRYGTEKSDGYYPCKMVKEFDLGSIPEDWLQSVSE